MKRLVFVNSNTKVAKIKAFMQMKGIQKYTLLESSQDFREELLVNSADIYIFDFYGDIRIIESLMDFVDHVNDLHVYAESIRIGKMYSRLSPDVFVLPSEIDLLLHFWETPSCRLNNAMLCDSCGKPSLHLREPEGLIIKTKRMQVAIDQAQVPVSYMDTYGKVQKGKAAQLQVTLKPRGLFTKPEGMVRHQPKFGEKVEVQQTVFEPRPAPAPKPPKPVKEKPVKPPKPVKEKPIKEKPIPEPVVEPVVQPVASKLPKEPVVKPIVASLLKPKAPEPEEATVKYVAANMEGSGEDKVHIDDEFDNTLTLLRDQEAVATPTAEDLGKQIQASLDKPKAEVEETLAEVPVEVVTEPVTEETAEVAIEVAPTEEVSESVTVHDEVYVPDSGVTQEELAGRLQVAQEPEEDSGEYAEPEAPKKSLFGGLFGGKSKKKKKEGFFEQTDIDWSGGDELVTESTSYTAQAFRARIITKIDDYMVSNRFITSEQKETVQARVDEIRRSSGKEPRFGDIVLEMGLIDDEKYCDVIAGFRNIEILHWLHIKGLPVVVDRFDRASYGRERFFETTPTADGRVRIIASVNSTAIDEKIRKYAENCIIQYTIDSYITKKLEESQEV